MLSKDLLKEENAKIMQKLTEAMQADDKDAMQQALTEFCNGVQQRVVEEAMQFSLSADREVLASRGIRQLTTEEKKFYQAWIDVHKNGNIKQALTDIDKAIPLTVIDSVMEDLREQHPLLNEIDFVNATGAIKMIINTGDVQLATWSKITSAITEELAMAIDTVDLTQSKLSAFIPISKDLLILGPTWLDNYVRLILTEASAIGLEKAILKGTGKEQPIGMCKDLKGAVKEGVYTDKKKVVLSSLEPEAYCAVIAPLAKKPAGGFRAVPEVVLIVNPVDYIAKVSPASTARAADGTYRYNIFPYPTKTIQSAALTEGEAIIGIGKRYFMAVGAGTSGKLEYSDEYQFLEDNRVYLIKMFGTGRPKDNNAFQYLDISNLKVAPIKVLNVTEVAADTTTTDDSEATT